MPIEHLLRWKPVRALVDRARTRLWTQAQWPDPERLHHEEGIYALAAFLRQCWSPAMTADILAHRGASIHPQACPVGPNVTVHAFGDSFANLSIGAHAHVGREVFLDLTDRIVIEDGVSVGMRAIILTHLDVRERPNAKQHAPTILRRGCSVGAGAIVLCGVEIGEDAVIGAGVVVDRNVPPRTVVTRRGHEADHTLPETLLRESGQALGREHKA